MKEENARSADEQELEQTIAQLKATEKVLQEKVLPLKDVEATAREDRVRLERSAEELGFVRMDLTALRGNAGPHLRQELSNIRNMATCALDSSQVASDAYRRIQTFQADVRTTITGITSATGTAFYYGTSGYYETRAQNPALDPEPPSSKHYPLPYVQEAATSDQTELDCILSGLGSHLIEKLRGARAALANKQPDYVAQASESMQELLDQVLHHFSDDVGKGENDGKMKKASWWKPAADVCGGVTRSHRVRFVVQGYAARVDDETERRINDLIKQVSALGGIQGEKHRRGSSGDELEILARRHLQALERFLLYLLRSHRPDLHTT